MTEEPITTKLKEAYDKLQETRAREAVNMLQARAEMAEAIQEAHEQGLTNYRIAQLLNTDRTAIARMSRGLWLPPGQKVPTVEALAARSGSVVVPRPEVPAEPQEAAQGRSASDDWKAVPRPKLQCRYCSDEAAYAINMADGKSILVCRKHKPKE